jgi:hypothetical protein
MSISPQACGEERLLWPGTRVLEDLGPNPVETCGPGCDKPGNETILKQLQVKVQSGPAQTATLQGLKGLCEVEVTHPEESAVSS